MEEKQDVQKKKRWRGSVLAGIAIILYCGGMLALFLSVCMSDPGDRPPWYLILFLAAFPTAAIIGIIVALFQRKKEIQKGEEDAAAKY